MSTVCWITTASGGNRQFQSRLHIVPDSGSSGCIVNNVRFLTDVEQFPPIFMELEGGNAGDTSHRGDQKVEVGTKDQSISWHTIYHPSNLTCSPAGGAMTLARLLQDIEGDVHYPAGATAIKLMKGKWKEAWRVYLSLQYYLPTIVQIWTFWSVSVRSSRWEQWVSRLALVTVTWFGTKKWLTVACILSKKMFRMSQHSMTPVYQQHSRNSIFCA